MKFSFRYWALSQISTVLFGLIARPPYSHWGFLYLFGFPVVMGFALGTVEEKLQ